MAFSAPCKLTYAESQSWEAHNDFGTGRFLSENVLEARLSLQSTDLAGKRLELLREVVPDLRRLAVMAHVGNPGAVPEMDEVQVAARARAFIRKR